MDKTVAGLIGAVSALVAAGPSHAAASAPLTLHEAMAASSYADLLRPIPNAAALLQQSATDDEAMTPDGQPVIQEVQFHHHHHHHHRRYRRHHHHHHHRRY